MTTNLVKTKSGHAAWNACEKCGSLWLDAGELDKIAYQVAGDIEYCSTDLADDRSNRKYKCLRCDGVQLEEVKFLGDDSILLHRCPECGGFWLNGGELNLLNKTLKHLMPVQGGGFSDFVNNVHVPYWFQRVQKRSSETDYVNPYEPIRGAKLKGSTDDACPACNSKLNEYRIFGIRIESCPQCKGIWLEQDELRRLKNHYKHGCLRWVNQEIENIEHTHFIATQRNCPHCPSQKLMAAIFGQSKLVIDFCQNCHGQWLERQEYDAIVEYLTQDLAMNPHQIEQIAMEDLKKVWQGAPEGRLAELRDAYAALSAFKNQLIFEHSGFNQHLLKMQGNILKTVG